MSVAAFAALAGLLGLAIGRLWDTRAESSRWQRDQLIKSCENLVGAYYELREALRALAMAVPGTAESEAIEIRVYELAASGWNQQIVAAWLYGSPPVIATAENFDHRVVELFFYAKDHHLTWQEFQKARAASQDALDHYIGAVRKELRQPVARPEIHYSRPGIPSPPDVEELGT